VSANTITPITTVTNHMARRDPSVQPGADFVLWPYRMSWRLPPLQTRTPQQHIANE
jgi:hypothetical protein